MWIEEKPRKDILGKRWNFAIWHDVWTDERVLSAERLFFWDDEHKHCGVVLFPAGNTVHFSRIRTLIAKLVADPNKREQHKRELRFPLERYYSENGAFPEEK